MNLLFAIFFWISSAMGFAPWSNADYTVTWTAPTENTDGTTLTDLDGFKLWCIPAFEADGVTRRTYGQPSIHPATATSYFKFWPSPAGEWVCKMRAFNSAGVDSADSPEIFFTLVDLDGDGNPEVSSGVIPPLVPGSPNAVILTCPDAEPGGCRSNEFTVTRSGYFTITGPDGTWLLKPDGSTRNLTTREEAFEYISKDGRSGEFVINPPPYTVVYQ